MSLDTLQDLFEDQMKDLYNAENQIAKALPKMAKKAKNATLKQGFLDHLEETKGQIARAAKVAELVGFKPTGKVCMATKGLVEEGKEVLEEDGDPAVIDLGLVGAAQRIEHYEIAGYGNVVAIAQKLKLDPEVINLLKATLAEEEAADKKLTAVSKAELFAAALTAGSEAK